MKRNSKGGKKFKKGKKFQPEKNQMIYKENGEDYAKVEKLLGAGRLYGTLQDGTNILCTIPGKMRRKKWIKNGDIILIGIREFQKDKADVLHCYNDSQISLLKSQNALPDSFINNNMESNNIFDENIVFTEEDDSNLEAPVDTKVKESKLDSISLDDQDLEEDINIEDI